MNKLSDLEAQVDDIRTPERVAGLEINPIEGGFMVYQPENNRVHYLNHTSLLVLELCSGRSSIAAIAECVRDAYNLDEAPTAEVSEIISRMQTEALVNLH